MLGWLAAAAAPLVIHLLSRRRYQEVPWAAVQYLLAAVRKNSRRIHLENWLILAVRTALVMAVVAAVAEPMIERSGVVAHTGQPTHKILVLDASYSMAYKPTDRTRFDRAKQLAEQIVEERGQGDGFTLVLLADPPQTIVATPSFSPTEFLGEIAATRITHGGADLASTLAQVEQVVTAARREYPRLTREQIYILTDLGRTTWAPDLSAAALGEFRERSRRLGESASLSVIDLGQAGAENIAVEQLRLQDGFVTVGQETIISAELRNFGRQARSGQTIELFVDGRHTAQRAIDLAAGGRAAVSFPCYFDSAGEHAIEVRLTPDLLELDNRRYLAAPVKDQVRVLCVDGRPSGGRFKSATDFLTVALSPTAGDRQRSRVHPEVVAESALLDTDLTQYECVFLCNVAQFTEREAAVLQSYLNFGGGLVFFLGDQVQPENYNRLLAAKTDSDRHVLPARLGSPVEAGEHGLDPLGYRHPLVAAFRDAEQTGLLTTPLQTYFQLQLPQPTRAQVALAAGKGDPLVVEETIGRGRSILVATSADVSWTAMPMWPSYVPLVQEMLLFAAGGRLGEHNLLVGQPLGGVLPQGRASGAAVHLPSGETKRAVVTNDGADRAWSYAETSQSGIYRVAPADQSGTSQAEQAFAVNLNTAESDLEQVTPEELARDVWPGVRYFHRTNWRDSEPGTTEAIVVRNRLHIWLLATAVCLLLTESFLTWFSGRYAQ